MRIRTASDIALVFRRRRIECGFSQTALADAIGTSRKWLSAFEAGKPTVELERVLLLADALGLIIDVVPRPASSIDLDVITGVEHDG